MCVCVCRPAGEAGALLLAVGPRVVRWRWKGTGSSSGGGAGVPGAPNSVPAGYDVIRDYKSKVG